MFVILRLIILAPALSFGFSWLSTPEKAKVPISADLGPADMLTQEEIDAFQVNYNKLLAYSSKPDCFKQAAGLVRRQCSELELDEEARVNAAISMTLCEIATAQHHSLPLECRPYQRPVNKPISRRVQGECVDSLARSAQFWSSYSGYLREIPQLCHAFRRWNDIDLAKDIYRKATMEKVSFVRLIIDREQVLLNQTDKWTSLAMEMGLMAKDIRALTEEHQSSTQKFSARLEEQASDALSRFWSMAQEALIRRDQMTENFRLALGVIVDSHSSELTMLVDSINTLLASRLNESFSIQRARTSSIDQSLSVIEKRWVDLGFDFVRMKQSLSQLSDQSEEIRDQLQTTLGGLHELNVHNIEMSDAVAALTTTVKHISRTAHDGLDRINNSAQLINRELQVQIERRRSSDAAAWIIRGVMALGSTIFGANEWGALSGHTSFRVLLALLDLGYGALRIGFAVALFVYFATRKIFVRAFARTISRLSAADAHQIQVSNQSGVAPNTRILTVADPEEMRPQRYPPFVSSLPIRGDLPRTRNVSRIPLRI